MLDTLLSTLAPHHCYGCNKAGVILCDNCKNDIVYEYFDKCILCGDTTLRGSCVECLPFVSQGWCIGEREGVLKRTLDAYKFERVKAAAGTLAELASGATPTFPSEYVIVPIPTTFRHIRQRGYDHSELLGKRLARLKKCQYDPVLKRRQQSMQRGRSRQERVKQASEAFGIQNTLEHGVYVLVDDVVTTGATLRAAAALLRAHGAKDVKAVALMRQPLD